MQEHRSGDRAASAPSAAPASYPNGSGESYAIGEATEAQSPRCASVSPSTCVAESLGRVTPLCRAQRILDHVAQRGLYDGIRWR